MMGRKIIKVDVDERTRLSTNSAMKYIIIVHQGERRLSLFVMNQMDMRRANPVLVSEAASMKQNMRNTAVSLPNELWITVFEPSPGTVMSAMSTRKLGQPVPTNSQRMRPAMRMPSTWNPACERPGNGGITAVRNMSSTLMTIMTYCFPLIPFPILILLLFYCRPPLI